MEIYLDSLLTLFPFSTHTTDPSAVGSNDYRKTSGNKSSPLPINSPSSSPSPRCSSPDTSLGASASSSPIFNPDLLPMENDGLSDKEDGVKMMKLKMGSLVEEKVCFAVLIWLESTLRHFISNISLFIVVMPTTIFNRKSLEIVVIKWWIMLKYGVIQ